MGFTSQSPSERWRQHRASAKRGSHFPFHRAIQKYGPDQFQFDIIYQSWDEVHCLDTIEPMLISEHGGLLHGYNICHGGSVPMLGRKLSDEHKAKISAGGRGVKRSSETCAAISAGKRGQPISDDHRAKLSVAPANRQVHVCPHCLKSGKGSQMFRWHFDKCGQRVH